MSTASVPEIHDLDRVTIRFAGDSGDGMQLTGTQFTKTTATLGNDVATLPDYPAEIRAPAGSLPGVSAFQLSFSSFNIHTPGDKPDVLVAMNPAALKVHLKDMLPGDTIIVNEDAFEPNNLRKAGYAASPLDDGTLKNYKVFRVPVSTMTIRALEPLGVNSKQADKSKNFFALGFLYWAYDRPLDITKRWISEKFAGKPDVAQANLKALETGYYFGETTETFKTRYHVKAAPQQPGEYRNISGNEASALGAVAATQLIGKPLVYASYPITPASDILHELSRFRHFGIKTVQAEDEIAAMCAAIGASFGGQLGMTGTSGPGVALKAEAIGLAVMTELPVVIVNVQRGGPSTGLPTKTEQADLMQAYYGRNGECPVPIVAPATPGECFHMMIEAFRIAVTHMLPVFFLSDGYLANGSEPWPIPDVSKIKPIKPCGWEANGREFKPYLRDEKTLARPWVNPGMAGFEHRIGGIEKANITGNVSYDPDNHDAMTRLRQEKVDRVALDIPDLEVIGDPEGDVLVLGWGSTYGTSLTAVERLRNKGLKVSLAHLRYLRPFPKNTEEVLRRFKKVIVPEINLGQLRSIIRDKYLIDAVGFNKVKGLPLKTHEIEEAVTALCNSH